MSLTTISGLTDADKEILIKNWDAQSLLLCLELKQNLMSRHQTMLRMNMQLKPRYNPSKQTKNINVEIKDRNKTENHFDHEAKQKPDTRRQGVSRA